MLKPTRTTLALATGSLVLGLVGAGAAVADDDGPENRPPQEIVVGDGSTEPGVYPERHVTGKVVSKGPLTVRSKPSTRSQSLGHVYPNSKVEIDCKKYGDNVDGNRIWYRLADRNSSLEQDAAAPKHAYDKERWVSARYVKNLSEVKYCR
ncbi:SH3 domain-containing protein [Streptomyces virginiae]|uniref:SH3 domain-containing protein n=1 Tax=Streptomyces virginiae TaxID=1961 RepID=UPI00224C9E67|nr:SH3 domain-containing protein [Streptomyces virginiae]MCX5174988.1 SH3 domain-containing protein [Streptomyces virginiae]